MKTVYHIHDMTDTLAQQGKGENCTSCCNLDLLEASSSKSRVKHDSTVTVKYMRTLGKKYYFFIILFIFQINLLCCQSSLKDYSYFTPERKQVLRMMG